MLCVTPELRNSELIDPLFQWHGPKGKVISGKRDSAAPASRRRRAVRRGECVRCALVRLRASVSGPVRRRDAVTCPVWTPGGRSPELRPGPGRPDAALCRELADHLRAAPEVSRLFRVREATTVAVGRPPLVAQVWRSERDSGFRGTHGGARSHGLVSASVCVLCSPHRGSWRPHQWLSFHAFYRMFPPDPDPDNVDI